MKAIAVVVCLLLVSCLRAEVVFVSEIVRHGARQPGQIFNFTVDPADNFSDSKELTEPGLRQHYLIGQEIRYRYVVPNNLTQVDFYSTDSSRTYDSGAGHLSGLYPAEICTQTLNESQQKHAVPSLEIDDKEEIIKELGEKALPKCFNLKPIKSEFETIDYINHFEASDCKAYIKIRSEAKDSEEYQAIIKPFVDYLDPRLHELTKWKKIFSVDDINNLCSYISIADFHKKKLVFEYNQTDIEYCTKLVSSKVYYNANGDERLWKLGSKPFFENLLKSFDNVIAGGEKKLELAFSHDYMLSILLNGFGVQFDDFIPFAATLFFELHRTGSEFYVRTLYLDKPLLFGDCTEEYCEYSKFKNYMLAIHPAGDIRELCESWKDAVFTPTKNVLMKPNGSSESGKAGEGLWSLFENTDFLTLLKFLLFAVIFMVIGYALAKARQRKRLDLQQREAFFAGLLKHQKLYQDQEEIIPLSSGKHIKM